MSHCIVHSLFALKKILEDSYDTLWRGSPLFLLLIKRQWISTLLQFTWSRPLWFFHWSTSCKKSENGFRIFESIGLRMNSSRFADVLWGKPALCLYLEAAISGHSGFLTFTDLVRFTQSKKRTILSLKKEPVLHILNNPLESQIIGPCRRAIRLISIFGPKSLWTRKYLIYLYLILLNL